MSDLAVRSSFNSKFYLGSIRGNAVAYGGNSFVAVAQRRSHF